MTVSCVLSFGVSGKASVRPLIPNLVVVADDVSPGHSLLISAPSVYLAVNCGGGKGGLTVLKKTLIEVLSPNCGVSAIVSCDPMVGGSGISCNGQVPQKRGGENGGIAD